MTDGTDRDPFALAGHAGEGDARVLALFHDYLAACQEMDRCADVDEDSWQEA
jgi:hypothetical protein